MFSTQSDNAETSFSKDQFDRVLTCLKELVDKLQVTSVLLINSAGRILARKNNGSGQGDPSVLSTLAASSYLAAGEMAALLGEGSNFKMVLHEGERHNIFICSVGSDHYLVIVFETHVALGMVRLYAKRTIKNLIPVLYEEKSTEQFESLFDQHFQNLLGDELDRSLKEFD